MDNDKRPLSPHIQVYRWQLTMLLSIMHRASGIALVAGLFILVYWLNALASGPESFAQAQSIFGSFLGMLVMFGFTAALYFHLCNGIRHLIWDAGHGIGKQQAFNSGRTVLIATGVLTLTSWLVGLIFF